MTIPFNLPTPMNGDPYNLPGYLNNPLTQVFKLVFERLHLNNLLVLFLLAGLMACNQKPAPSTDTLPTLPAAVTGQPTIESPDLTPTALPTPIPTRLLRICLGREPVSLFYYDANSTSARDILAAVYDGPIDIRNYVAYPVI